MKCFDIVSYSAMWDAFGLWFCGRNTFRPYMGMSICLPQALCKPNANVMKWGNKWQGQTRSFIIFQSVID